MKTACVLLCLQALLLVAGLSAVAVSGDSMDPAILLPSDDGAGLADLLTALTTEGGEEHKRPWGKCCDLAVCTRSIPPTCRCLDKVDRCFSSCKACEETEDSRHTCSDWYRGFPGPKCKEGENEDVEGLADLGVEDAAAASASADGKKDDKSTRPWPCCDLQVCTKSQPPICHCRDVVKRCAKACKRCEEVETTTSGRAHHKRYRCHDAHRGDPGPRCSREVRRGGYGFGFGYGN